MTDTKQYGEMKASFLEHGFTPDRAEFLVVDNIKGNSFDAYSGLTRLLNEARGRYVILCHQDLLLLDDGATELESRLAQLDERHPDWGIAGNSGITEDNRHVLHISDPHGENQHIGNLPERVSSLDENFLVVRKSSGIRPSAEMTGFHLYGTDLCLQARQLGHSACVIDFHLRHLSGGRMDEDFYRGEKAFERHWSVKLPSALVVRTTCTELILGSDSKARWLKALRSVRRHPWVHRLSRLIERGLA